MLTRWGAVDISSAPMDELRRRIDQLFGDIEAGRFLPLSDAPRLRMVDTGEALVLKAEVPGLSDRDITLTIDEDALTLRGERALDAPKGYAVQRQERPVLRFSRSVLLPCKIDPETAAASIAHGLLTVTMRKAAVAQPRPIAVRSS